MSGRSRFRAFIIRLTNWEYWPVYIISIPVVFFCLYYAIRSSSLLFFTRVNPGITTAGLFGVSKWNILQHIPQALIPKTILLKAGYGRCKDVEAKMLASGIAFPCIVKPDIGERGRGVQVIHDHASLVKYLSVYSHADIILQEYVDLPQEYSILCYRIPGNGQSGVSSICGKEFLGVTGDGHRTVRELMQADARAVVQLARMEEESNSKLNSVPAQGEHILLEPIGNHCRGTMFVDRNDLKSPELESCFLSILSEMENIHYGRFDVRATDENGLTRKNGFKILEFNGVASEPAHVYDPGFTPIKAYRDFMRHWRILYHIAKVQEQRGVQTMPVRDFFSLWRSYRKHVRLMTRDTKLITNGTNVPAGSINSPQVVR